MGSIFQETVASKFKSRVRDSRIIHVIRPTRRMIWNWQDFALDRLAVIGPQLSFRLLVTSIPKAGLHLLKELLGQLRELNRRPLPLPNNRPVTEHLESFAVMARNRYAHWHYGATPETLRLAREGDAGIAILFRDPRDIAVSFVDYVCRLETHALHHYFRGLPNHRARLECVILGMPPGAIQADPAIRQMQRHNATYPGLTDIGSVCRSYLGWSSHPRTHVCKFEDLVGRKGGGCDLTQFETAKRLLGFLQVDDSEHRVLCLCRGIYNPRSVTFNRGVLGRWKESFDDRLREMFKQAAGQELVRMGYEKDDQW